MKREERESRRRVRKEEIDCPEEKRERGRELECAKERERGGKEKEGKGRREEQRKKSEGGRKGIPCQGEGKREGKLINGV